MTIDETIKILNRDLAIQKQYKALPDGIEAMETAIKGLEAWEKVKEEIATCFDIWRFNYNEFAMGKCSAFADYIEVINKYMQEVEK